MAHYITTHNASGQSVFSSSSQEKRPSQQMGPANVETVYTFSTFPADLSNEQDIKAYDTSQPADFAQSKVAVVIGNFPPGAETPMHRTPTANIGVILEGEMELHLDSGEVRTLRTGDTYTQRGTAHRWKNVGEGWVRTATFTVPAVGLEKGSVADEKAPSWFDTLKDTMDRSTGGE